MTDFAGCFFGVQQVSLHGGSVRVVAHAALLEPGWLMSMDLREAITLMAIETSAFKNKPGAPIQAVALCARNVRNRGMLVKRLKAGGRIGTRKEAHFLSSSFPQQGQRVQARGNFDYRVKYIRKGLFGLNGGAVQLQFSRWRGGHYVNLSAF